MEIENQSRLKLILPEFNLLLQHTKATRESDN